jgi:hypothetical protein
VNNVLLNLKLPTSAAAQLAALAAHMMNGMKTIIPGAAIPKTRGSFLKAADPAAKVAVAKQK